MAQSDLALVGEDRYIEQGDFSLFQSVADEETDDALADGAYLVQGVGVEIFIVGEEVADGFVFGVEVACGDNLAVLLDEDGMKETRCGAGRAGELAEIGGEWGAVAAELQMDRALSGSDARRKNSVLFKFI